MKKSMSMCILLLLLVSCGEKKNIQEEKKESLKQVKTQELKMEIFDNIKDYNGELVPAKEVSILTPTGGYIKEIKNKNGDRVKKGDIILTLTDTDTESKYYEAEGTLIKAKSEYSTNETSYKKYKNLYEKKFISEDTYLGSKNQLSQSLGNLKIAQAGYLNSKDNFDRLTVVANISGVITDLSLKEHEKLSANQKVLTIVDNDIMELKMAISGEDIKNTKIGNEAVIYIDNLRKKVNGRVDSVNLSANSNTKKYDVKILIDNSSNEILKGMYGQVQMNQGKIEGIFVPKEAIMIKDLYAYIVVVRENKSLIYKVEQLSSIGNLQEIVFKDYQIGDRIVVQGQYLLNNNDKVKES